MVKSFKRGVHPKENKLSSGSEIKRFRIPDKLVILLRQHLGGCVDPKVKVGDHVKKYQVLGDIDDCMCAPIHAPTSGKVISIGKRAHPSGGMYDSIVLETDKKDETAPYRRNKLNELSPEKIVDLIGKAGIVGLGGAACPTKLKLQSKTKPDTYILNGCECEPYITADHRIMLEHADEIISGFRALMKASGTERGIIAVEDNKRDAYERLKRAATGYGDISVELVRTMYPQGAEKMLIYALTKRKVPLGKLPADVGVIVNNVGTAKAVHDAVIEGKPLIERVVTVTGDVETPSNFLTLIGTSFNDLIAECKPKGEPKKIINGGPMMGISIDDINVPVVKGTSSVLVLKDPTHHEEDPCIRCARCVENCPMNLAPVLIVKNVKKKKYADAKELNVSACIECGICSYGCPSKIPLLHYMREAKKEIRKNAGKK